MVTGSYAQLDAIQNEIVRWWNADLRGNAQLHINSVGVDVSNNRVVVGVTQPDEPFEHLVRAWRGDMVEVRLEAQSRPLICDFPVPENTPEFCL